MKKRLADLFTKDVTPAVTYRWVCNNCFGTIESGQQRWKCVDCAGYDLCDACHKLGVHSEHDQFLETKHRFELKEQVNSNCCAETLNNAFLAYKNRRCFGLRQGNEYKWLTYGQIHERVLNFAAGLVDVGIIPKKQQTKRTFVSICSRNNLQWFIADYALIHKAAIPVPIHFSLSDKDMTFINNNTEACAVICTSDLLERFIQMRDTGACPALKYIIIMDATTPPKQPNVFTFSNIEERGAKKKKYKQLVPLQPTDLLTLVYTSGRYDLNCVDLHSSTGKPKGAMIPDKSYNIALCSHVREDLQISITFSPLAHMVRFIELFLTCKTDRKYVALCLCNGASVAIFERAMEFVFEDIALVRPTVLISTPRLYNVLYNEYQRCMTNAPDQEKQVLEKMRGMLGGRLQSITTGGAPTSTPVLNFLHKCFPKCNITNGYGATEVGGIMNDGYLHADVEFKLIDVPEMNYYSTDQPYPRGELLVKTTSMFMGYLNEEELTSNALDKQGYVHTGDIVEHTGKRSFKIIDRKKNIFKLAQGEYVAPEAVENAYLESSLIDQIYIYGNTTRAYVLAVVVPTSDNLTTDHDTLSELIIEDMKQIAKKAELQPYEIPRAIVIETDPFTNENEKLTSSMKIARFNCERIYKQQLEQLYEKLQQEEEKQMVDEFEEILGKSCGTNAKLSSMGIDSLHAVRFVNLIKKKYSVEVPITLLFDGKTSVSDVTSFIMNKKTVTGHEQVDWMKEIQVEPIVPKIEINDQLLSLQDKNVLLTGCTGFLGAFLLARLLTSSNCNVYCLVRATNNDGITRIQSTMNSFKLWKDEYATRIHAINGSLSRPLLGINQETYDQLASKIHIIYHNAAVVNSVMSYQQLKEDNVDGTRSLLEFATCSRIKVFHYISTIGVAQGFSKHVDESDQQENEIALCSRINCLGGYGQSKWVAEQLVRKYQQCGLPVTIYRPGMISGDTQHGCCNLSDWVTRFIRGCIVMGMYPDTSGRSLTAIPVDIVSDIIVSLSQRQESTSQYCFNVVTSDGMTFDKIMETASSTLPERTSMVKVSFEVWKEELKKQVEKAEGTPRYDALWPLVALFRKGFYSQGAPFGNEKMVASYGQDLSPINEDLVKKFVHFLDERGLTRQATE